MAARPTPTMPPTKTSTVAALKIAGTVKHTGGEPGKHLQKDGPREAQMGPCLKGR